MGYYGFDRALACIACIVGDGAHWITVASFNLAVGH